MKLFRKLTLINDFGEQINHLFEVVPFSGKYCSRYKQVSLVDELGPSFGNRIESIAPYSKNGLRKQDNEGAPEKNHPKSMQLSVIFPKTDDFHQTEIQRHNLKLCWDFPLEHGTHGELYDFWDHLFLY